MWVDYWGAKGYVGPLPKLLPTSPSPPPLVFLRLCIKMAEVFDCGKRFKYTASSDDMQIMRTATPNVLLDEIIPLCYKHASFFYKTS